MIRSDVSMNSVLKCNICKPIRRSHASYLWTERSISQQYKALAESRCKVFSIRVLYILANFSLDFSAESGKIDPQAFRVDPQVGQQASTSVVDVLIQ